MLSLGRYFKISFHREMFPTWRPVIGQVNAHVEWIGEIPVHSLRLSRGLEGGRIFVSFVCNGRSVTQSRTKTTGFHCHYYVCLIGRSVAAAAAAEDRPLGWPWRIPTEVSRQEPANNKKIFFCRLTYSVLFFRWIDVIWGEMNEMHKALFKLGFLC